MIDSTAPNPSSSPAKKRTFHKKWWIVAAIVLVIGVAGATGYWFYRSNQKPVSTQGLISPEVLRAQARDKTTAEAEKLANNGQVDKAAAVYDSAIKQTDDPYEKSVALLNKANLSFDANDYDAALAIAKEAEAINENRAVTEYIAQIYEAKGDSAKAIEYYQKTIPLVDKSKPMADSYIHYYQSRIAELGGAKS